MKSMQHKLENKSSWKEFSKNTTLKERIETHHSQVFIKEEGTDGVRTTIHLENTVEQKTNNKHFKKKYFYTFKNTLSNYCLVKEEIKSAIIEKIKHEYYRLKPVER